jgi:hypothetical protein
VAARCAPQLLSTGCSPTPAGRLDWITSFTYKIWSSRSWWNSCTKIDWEKEQKKIKYKRADCIGMLETAPVVLANSIAARVGRLDNRPSNNISQTWTYLRITVRRWRQTSNNKYCAHLFNIRSTRSFDTCLSSKNKRITQ